MCWKVSFKHGDVEIIETLKQRIIRKVAMSLRMLPLKGINIVFTGF